MFVLAACVFALTLSGCGASKNADALLTSYTAAIEKMGYGLRQYESPIENDDAPVLKDVWGIIEHNTEDDDETSGIRITESSKGVYSVTLRIDEDAENRNIEPFLQLAGTLMQQCDATFGFGEKAAVRAAQRVVDAANKASSYSRNNFTYTISLYNDSIHFQVDFPNARYALSARELSAARGETWCDFGISINSFKEDFGAMLGEYGYTLTNYDDSKEELNPTRTNMLADKPVAFLFSHQEGFVDGAILVYLDGQTVYRVELVKIRNAEFLLDYTELAALLVQYFDAGLSDDPSVAKEKAKAKVETIFTAGSLDESNLHYEAEDLYPNDIFTVSPAQP